MLGGRGGVGGVVSHLGKTRCPFTIHAHGPHAGVGLPLRNVGRKARQDERGGGGDAKKASATGRRPEHSAEGQDFLLLAFSPVLTLAQSTGVLTLTPWHCPNFTSQGAYF